MKFDDLKNASTVTLKQEQSYLEIIRNKVYLNVSSGDVCFRMSEFWGIVPAGEYDAYTLLDNVSEIIKRLEKTGILKEVSFGEAEMQHTMFSCNVDTERLISYIADIEREIDIRMNPRPVMDNGGLRFQGESFRFIGKEKELLKYLFDHCNSIVTKEELFKAVYGKDYNFEVAKYGKVEALEPLESLFKKVKKKVLANPTLKKVLVLVQQEGFGLFFNSQ